MAVCVLFITQAKWFKDYKLRLAFNDGKKQTVDFGPFLKASNHPAIRDFLSLKKFKSFRLEYGDLVWGDYELCFPIADLYENKV